MIPASTAAKAEHHLDAGKAPSSPALHPDLTGFGLMCAECKSCQTSRVVNVSLSPPRPDSGVTAARVLFSSGHPHRTYEDWRSYSSPGPRPVDIGNENCHRRAPEQAPWQQRPFEAGRCRLCCHGAESLYGSHQPPSSHHMPTCLTMCQTPGQIKTTQTPLRTPAQRRF